MYIMYDSVDYGQIPKEPHAVLYYINGHEGVRTEQQMRRAFPNARLLPISVTGHVPAPAYDIEKGDYDPSEVDALFTIAKAHGIWRPCFYANLSTMPAVKSALNRVVKKREDVRLWVAEYDDEAVIPPGYDGKQFTDHALGRNLDESILRSDFFQPVPRPQPAHSAQKPEWWEAKVRVNHATGEWRVSPLPAQAS